MQRFNGAEVSGHNEEGVYGEVTAVEKESSKGDLKDVGTVKGIVGPAKGFVAMGDDNEETCNSSETLRISGGVVLVR